MSHEASDVRPALRIGCVSYINTKPLIYGLENQPDLKLFLDVPARLLEGLRAAQFDVALLPVIDYQRMEGLKLVRAGGIGCDGPTLTVRIFSKVPVGEIRKLACDVESHTSVALARIILAERYGLRPEFSPLERGQTSQRGAESRLLIGDKVVCEEPAGFEHQLDLGAAWKQLTGLPFVFAAWMAPTGSTWAIFRSGCAAWQTGLGHVDEIVERHAAPRGWPARTAVQYLTEYLKFDIGPRQLEAIRRFHALAAEHQAIGSPVQALRVYGED